MARKNLYWPENFQSTSNWPVLTGFNQYWSRAWSILILTTFLPTLKQKDPCYMYKYRQLGHWTSKCTNGYFGKPPISSSTATTTYQPLNPATCHYIQCISAEMWNPEPPNDEPPKQKRKLSRSKVEKKLCKVLFKNYAVENCVRNVFIHWTYTLCSKLCYSVDLQTVFKTVLFSGLSKLCSKLC
jgi:hypothetical protein